MFCLFERITRFFSCNVSRAVLWSISRIFSRASSTRPISHIAPSKLSRLGWPNWHIRLQKHRLCGAGIRMAVGGASHTNVTRSLLRKGLPRLDGTDTNWAADVLLKVLLSAHR